MGFDRLSAEHSVQALQALMDELGLDAVAPTDVAQAQAALTTLGSNIFHNGGTYAPTTPGTGGRAAFEAGEEPDIPERPKDRFVSLARRAANGESLATNDLFLLEALMHQYDPNNAFVVDGEISPDELLTINGFLENPNAPISDVRTNVTGLFNNRAAELAQAAHLLAIEEARLAAATALANATTAEGVAEANLALAETNLEGLLAEQDVNFSAAEQDMLVLQGQMAAAGIIPASMVNGAWTDAHIDALINATYNNPDAYFTMVPALGSNMSEVTRNMFVSPPNNYNPDMQGIQAVVNHLNEGRDLTSTIEEALASGDPNQIEIVQAMTGQFVTGEWDEASLNAAREALETPIYTMSGEIGFPDHLYSASRQEVNVSGVAEALRNGEMAMPSDEQLATISPELSFMAPEDRVAAWLAEPENHDAYIEMVAEQAITLDTEALIAASTDVVADRITAEELLIANARQAVADARLELDAAILARETASNAQLHVATNNPFAVAPDSALAAAVGVIGDERDGVATLTGPEAAIQAVANAVITSEYAEGGQIALHDLTAVMVDLYEVDEGGNQGPLGDATSAELLDNMLMYASTDDADLYDGDTLDVTTPEGIQDMLYVTLYATDASDGGNKIYTLTRGEDGHFILGGAPQELLDQVNSVAERLAGDAEAPTDLAPADAPDADALVADADTTVITPGPVSEVTELVAEQRVMPDYLTAFDDSAAEALYVRLSANFEADPRDSLARDREAPEELRDLARLQARIETRIEGLANGSIAGNPASIQGDIVSMHHRFEEIYAGLSEEDKAQFETYIEQRGAPVAPEAEGDMLLSAADRLAADSNLGAQLAATGGALTGSELLVAIAEGVDYITTGYMEAAFGTTTPTEREQVADNRASPTVMTPGVA